MPGENKGKSNQQPRMDELISLREAVELSGLKQPHLALMIRKGELWGKKVGRNWVTTAQVVRNYLARNRRPGPKAKTDA
jgi:hypothetical protein